ncbi:UNKNOWN [Stylonychia lemnae]|uniref:Uncharacterized protein n=1 Tax=Stylonychia lemnae TaxID=5949 RepID=A0A078AY52_STYLE|nr:UNKNOWN [Stylonychia lemnae]|eukprot:CDW86142.1 UNKNOWN [Stylonychia lemnae]
MNSKRLLLDQITKRIQHKFGFDQKSYFLIQQCVKEKLVDKSKLSPQELQEIEEYIKNLDYIKLNRDNKQLTSASIKNLNQTANLGSIGDLEASPLKSVNESKLDDSNVYQLDYFSRRSGSNANYPNKNNLDTSSNMGRVNLRGNLEQISRAGNDIVSSYQSSRNTNLSVKAYSTNKINELKAKQHEDEWAQILKADIDKKNQIEKEKQLSMQNQKKNLQDFLQMQVEEKKRKEEMQKLQKQNDLIDLVGTLRNDIQQIDHEKSQVIQKKQYEKELKVGQLHLDQKKKELDKQLRYEEELYTETSLPFDKYKQKEILEKKEQVKLYSQVNEKVMAQKQQEKQIKKLEEVKKSPEEPFLDRLMVKNFKMYQNDHESRLKLQEQSADIYRKAHQNDVSIQELAYKDEVKARHHVDVQLRKQQQYNGLVEQKRQKDIEEYKKWQQLHDQEKQQKEMAQKMQYSVEKQKMDEHIHKIQIEEKKKFEESKIQKIQYRYEIDNQVNEKINNLFIQNHKLGPKELMTNRRELQIAQQLI